MMRTGTTLLLCGTSLLATPAIGQTTTVNEGAPPTTAAAQTSSAETAANGTAGDIIVTAQKRAENLQRVPLAVTAVAGEALRENAVSSLVTFSQAVPTLSIGQSFGEGNVALRGISLNAVNFATEGSIALHIDGVYVQRPAAALSSFYDVQRIEVLRGPQGTLYGRNATGGSINIISVDPTTTPSGYAQLTGGTYGHVAVEAAAGGPLGGSDKLLYRAAVHFDRHTGWGRNEATGSDVDDRNSRSARLKLLWQPTSALRLLLTGDYTRNRGLVGSHVENTITGQPPFGNRFTGPTGTIVLGGTFARRLEDVNTETDLRHRATFWGLSLNGSYDVGDATFRSISAYRRSKSYTEAEVDHTNYPLFGPGNVFDDAYQLSQEFQLAGTAGATDYIVGLYYFHEKDRGHVYFAINNVLLNLFGVPVPPSNPPAAGLTQGYVTEGFIKTDAYAAFGQITQHFSDVFSVTLGGRYSIERKEELGLGTTDLGTPYRGSQNFLGLRPNDGRITATGGNQCGVGLPAIGYSAATGACDPVTTFKAFTPKLGVEIKPDAQTLVYASVSRGFKSGVYNIGSAQPAVDPEKVTDYEAGLKKTWLNGGLRTNIAGFYYDYKDLQVNLTKTGANGAPTQILKNAATARIYGVEAEVVARPSRALQLDAVASYLNARFRRFVTQDDARGGGDGVTRDESGAPAFNLAGNRLPQSPEFSGRLGASLFQDVAGGQVTLRGEMVFSSRIFFTPFNTDTASVGARQRFNASVNFATGDDRWSVTLSAKNLTDKRRIVNGFAMSRLAGAPLAGYIEEPRTVDLIVNYRF